MPSGKSSFLSTPSARRATQRHFDGIALERISIHALREEGDCRFITCSTSAKLFLSTPSARRATRNSISLGHCRSYFYPRPPRGGRPLTPRKARPRLAISIHALREEGDHDPPTRATAQGNFYPRPPRGGRQMEKMKKSQTRKFLSTPSARRAT